MSKITKEQFLQDVRTEVEVLKNNATQEEVANLNFETFRPKDANACIYGQMTGRCDTDRAKELMDKACVRVTTEDADAFTNKNFDEVTEYINGKYDGQTWKEDHSWGSNRRYTYLSMIEAYILMLGAKPKNIIDYLKGEVETLELPLN